MRDTKQEPRKFNPAGTATLLWAWVIFPFFLYALFQKVIFGNSLSSMMDGVYVSYGASALYFSVFFTLSVQAFRNPHRVSAVFALGMLCWVLCYTFFVFQALASL